MLKCLPLSLLSAISLTPTLSAQPKIVPLEGALYSASATIHPESVKIFTHSYEASGESIEEQASAIFTQLENELKAVGLDLSYIANVRGALLAPADGDLRAAMSEWNNAFSAAFKGIELTPTRTTVGTAALSDEPSLLAVDFVIAAPEVLDGGTPLVANPRIQAMPAGWRTVAPFTPMLFTSGTLADAVAAGSSDYGSMEDQTINTLEKLSDVLAFWGLTPADVVYTRALLSPPLSSEEEPEPMIDWPGYAAGWDAFWNSTRAPAPPVSTFSGPGFNTTGRLIEIEVYAAFPDAMGPFRRPEAAGPILREGSDTSFLSRSTAVSRSSSLTWFAGVVDNTRNDHEGQGLNALLTLGDRMKAAKVDFGNIIQLRAYLNIQESFRPEFASWNRAYGRFFNHTEMNPAKPVRTAFPVEALPGNWLIEIELLGVATP